MPLSIAWKSCLDLAEKAHFIGPQRGDITVLIPWLVQYINIWSSSYKEHMPLLLLRESCQSMQAALDRHLMHLQVWYLV